MSVEELEQAVAKLSGPELERFREWFAHFDGDSWDQQIAQDAANGRLDALADEALREHRAGESREL